MRRSEINHIISQAKLFFNSRQFHLPPWAFWSPQDWYGKGEICREIIDNMLGWDITDFGKNDYYSCGLLLFTLRNGNLIRDNKVYGEKIMIAEEGQITPMHFHWSKLEDIINRGGGKLVMKLYSSTKDESLSENPLRARVDGIERSFQPGEELVLQPGESVCLEPGLYHEFWAQPGSGKVMVGEVSAVNDDNTDNRFYENVGRFPEIQEDEPPLHLLVSDYLNYI
ncbi:MAG: D-lyxose/D-mannose family sugar isomerase [candidate division KSB1 bacterium]|nr:D-lyxose/D-mannose family sugar isomerase [candidate division KSB1 bacterium]